METLEILRAKYTDAANNKVVTINLKIKRRQIGQPGSLRNDTKGRSIGARPSNEIQGKFTSLKKAFIDDPASYIHPVGTIVGYEGGKYRIDKQSINQEGHNIQFQVNFNIFFNSIYSIIYIIAQADSNTFALVFVDVNLNFENPRDKNRKFHYGNEDPKDKGVADKARNKKSDAIQLREIQDINTLELQRSKDEGRGIDIDRQMNKYVAEALVQSFNQKVGYEIKVFVEITG